MRAFVVLAVLGCLTLGGCSGAGDGAADEAADFDDTGVRATATTGILLGVVVDERIVPIEGAAVELTGAATEQALTTDAEGRFAFGDLEPGSYFIAVSHFLHAPAQTSAEVVAGEEEPPVVRVLLTRLFEQEPFSEASKFDGYIQCGYANPQVSTQCVDDYTRFVVPGGLAPQVRELVDHRSYVSGVSGGWQSIVLELVWEPSAQGTSDELFVITSHYNRTGTHWYGRAEGAGPAAALRRRQDQPERFRSGPGGDRAGGAQRPVQLRGDRRRRRHRVLAVVHHLPPQLLLRLPARRLVVRRRPFPTVLTVRRGAGACRACRRRRRPPATSRATARPGGPSPRRCAAWARSMSPSAA
jgi:hypothetical protein